MLADIKTKFARQSLRSPLGGLIRGDLQPLKSMEFREKHEDDFVYGEIAYIHMPGGPTGGARPETR